MATMTAIMATARAEVMTTVAAAARLVAIAVTAGMMVARVAMIPTLKALALWNS